VRERKDSGDSRQECIAFREHDWPETRISVIALFSLTLRKQNHAHPLTLSQEKQVPGRIDPHFIHS
jgi:hypothetical protein